MRARTNWIAVATSALVLAVGSGCITFSAAPLAPEWTASQLPIPQGVDGLAIGVRPLDGLAEENELIGRPASRRGLATFVLLLQNTGSETFEVRSAGIRLETKRGESYAPILLPEVHDRLSYSQGTALWGLPFGILPAFLLGNRVTEQNQNLLADLHGKIFRDCTVDSDQPIRNSILFFDLGPEIAARLDPSHCQVIVDVERRPSPGRPGEWLRFQLSPTGAPRN